MDLVAWTRYAADKLFVKVTSRILTVVARSIPGIGEVG